MKFTTAQDDAIKTCVSRVRAREPVTKLFGFAGTGKTTIAKAIADEIGGDVAFACYTGKAASVLTRKGCPAKTIHSMFYWHIGEKEYKKGNGGTQQQPTFQFDKNKIEPPRALILDEVSMVDDEMGRNIVSAGIPIIAIGDPAQLPPVGNGGYFTNGEPDVMLTEVMRHEGGILELATDVRENGVGAIGKRKYRSMVLESIRRSEALSYDQVLVGTNDTRREKNDVIRRLKDIDEGEFIAVGDRIICTANSASHEVLNGQQFKVAGINGGDLEYRQESMIDLYLQCECVQDNEDKDALIKKCPICGWHPSYTPVWVAGFSGPQGEKWLSEQKFFRRKKAMEATYGYAITVNKAQGSEWGNILVVNESSKWRSDARRWLYTAITRAQDKITIIPNSGRNNR